MVAHCVNYNRSQLPISIERGPTVRLTLHRWKCPQIRIVSATVLTIDTCNCGVL
uniref:Uncharacterized protein n=1 Tax=Anguilla anguilla TaxID=7936 RepID=A0A0E9RT64_ANGAN